MTRASAASLACGQQGVRPGLPAAVQVGRAAGLDLRQGGVQRPAVAHRLRRSEGGDVVVEDDQRGDVGRLQAVDDVRGAAHRLGERLAGHRAGAVDDQGQVVGRRTFCCAGSAIGRLDAHQHGQLLRQALDQGRLQRGDEDGRIVGIGHLVSGLARRHCRGMGDKIPGHGLTECARPFGIEKRRPQMPEEGAKSPRPARRGRAFELRRHPLAQRLRLRPPCSRRRTS